MVYYRVRPPFRTMSTLKKSTGVGGQGPGSSKASEAVEGQAEQLLKLLKAKWKLRLQVRTRCSYFALVLFSLGTCGE